jgi:serine/threonine protein phosphatase 1
VSALLWQQAPGWLPEGERVYAIGDVHGCAARLAAIHARIADDLLERPARQATLIHLGDLVDRGEDVAGALDLALRRPTGIAAVVNLLGNHEDYVLAALAGDRGALRDWRDYGGQETLRAWGNDPFAEPATWRIPERHLALIRGMALTHRAGGYLFVHAGLRPGVPLAEQRREDLISIRRSFLDSEADHGAVVVHGHTPTRDRVPELRPNRINLDTGAVYGGVLSGVVLEGRRLALLTA